MMRGSERDKNRVYAILQYFLKNKKPPVDANKKAAWRREWENHEDELDEIIERNLHNDPPFDLTKTLPVIIKNKTQFMTPLFMANSFGFDHVAEILLKLPITALEMNTVLSMTPQFSKQPSIDAIKKLLNDIFSMVLKGRVNVKDDSGHETMQHVKILISPPDEKLQTVLVSALSELGIRTAVGFDGKKDNIIGHIIELYPTPENYQKFSKAGFREELLAKMEEKLSALSTPTKRPKG